MHWSSPCLMSSVYLESSSKLHELALFFCPFLRIYDELQSLNAFLSTCSQMQILHLCANWISTPWKIWIANFPSLPIFVFFLLYSCSDSVPKAITYSVSVFGVRSVQHNIKHHTFMYHAKICNIFMSRSQLARVLESEGIKTSTRRRSSRLSMLAAGQQVEDNICSQSRIQRGLILSNSCTLHSEH